MLPRARDFDPQLILISAGFDAAAGDLLGPFNLTPELYGKLTSRLCSLPCGKVVLVLEGGYGESLPSCFAACVNALIKSDTPASTPDRSSRRGYVSSPTA